METYVKNLCDAEENSRKLGVDEMLTEKVVFRGAKYDIGRPRSRVGLVSA